MTEPASKTARMLFRRLSFAGIVAALVSFAAGSSGASAAQVCTLDRATGTKVDQTPFLRNAIAIDWNFALNRIAYQTRDDANFEEVFTSAPDHMGATRLTPNRPALTKQQGVPRWSRDGRLILFVAQKEDWSGATIAGIPDYGALPGFGVHDDMWIGTSDGSKVWRLTDYPNTTNEGVLLPVFSADGKHIAWSERVSKSAYVLHVADFVTLPVPHLAHVQSFQPGGPAYYEPGSFSSDGTSFFYTSDQDSHVFWLSQIYRLDFATGAGTRLTSGLTYNEHPVVIATPAGDWVVYMSSKGADRLPGSRFLGTDWWAMQTDGAGAKRLTSMNVIGSPENAGFAQVAGRVSAVPTGAAMLGDVQTSLLTQAGLVRTVRFTCDGAR